MAPQVDLERIAAAVREILVAIGEDPGRDGLLETPARVARMYAETCAGLHDDPSRHLRTTFDVGHDEMIMVRDIPLYSLCEHHLVPFVGHAHVAYIPNEEGRVTGLSKLARLVDGFARRPQVQERLTAQVADSIEERLAPDILYDQVRLLVAGRCWWDDAPRSQWSFIYKQSDCGCPTVLGNVRLRMVNEMQAATLDELTHFSLRPIELRIDDHDRDDSAACASLQQASQTLPRLIVKSTGERGPNEQAIRLGERPGL